MKILVIGAKGQVGSEIIKRFSSTPHEVIAFSRNELDCSALSDVNWILAEVKPALIINAAAYTAVDKAEDEISLAQKINAQFVRELALYCQEAQIPLIHLSTDYVFDGTKQTPYSESDATNPQGVYAQSKLAGEEAILGCLEEHIILRVSWVFGVHGSNFVKTILNLAETRDELKIVADQWGIPTAAADIARVLLEIVNKMNTSSFNDWGIYHYAGKDMTNWYEFATVFLNMAKEQDLELALTKLTAIKTEEYPTKAMRPKYSVLNTNKIQEVLGIQSHSWKNYLPEFIDIYIKKKNYELSN